MTKGLLKAIAAAALVGTLALSMPAPAEAGHGITGRRERATRLGGRLDAAASDGSFSVRAHLPYGGGGE